ncbi:MAG: YceD family protein [Janthinobacterium lividum]
MNGFRIDAFEFSRLNDSREGTLAVGELERLKEELADESGTLEWALQGGTDKYGNAQLKMHVAGHVHLRCQRCLGSLPFDIDSDTTLILAADEGKADDIEEMIDDESIDVIVGSKSFDMLALIEDDALLALPLAPMHDVCPDPEAQELLAGSEKPSPFAILKSLKKE